MKGIEMSKSDRSPNRGSSFKTKPGFQNETRAPRAYLTAPNSHQRVQVIYRAGALAEGTESEMRRYFRATFPDDPMTRYQDGEFHPVEDSPC